jgi:hypothetical protein
MDRNGRQSNKSIFSSRAGPNVTQFADTPTFTVRTAVGRSDVNIVYLMLLD